MLIAELTDFKRAATYKGMSRKLAGKTSPVTPEPNVAL